MVADMTMRLTASVVAMVVGGGVVGPIPAAEAGSAVTAPAPIIDTVVGTVTGEGDDPGDGGPAREADIGSPREVAVGPDGAVYVLTGLQVWAVDPETGTVRAVAGTGEPGFSGDGGSATKARFSEAVDHALDNGVGGLAVGPDGTVYVADTSKLPQGELHLLDAGHTRCWRTPPSTAAWSTTW